MTSIQPKWLTNILVCIPDTLWAVAQPCKLHTMGIGEQKERCKDAFAINMAAVFGIHETTRNSTKREENTRKGE